MMLVEAISCIVDSVEDPDELLPSFLVLSFLV